MFRELICFCGLQLQQLHHLTPFRRVARRLGRKAGRRRARILLPANPAPIRVCRTTPRRGRRPRPHREVCRQEPPNPGAAFLLRRQSYNRCRRRRKPPAHLSPTAPADALAHERDRHRPARRPDRPAREARRRPRLLQRDLQPQSLCRQRDRLRVRPGQPVAQRPARRAPRAALPAAAGRPGQARPRRPRGNPRRRGRHPPRLADVRKMGRRRAFGRQLAAAVRPRAASPTASSRSPTTPRSATRSPAPTTPPPSAASASTTPPSASTGGSRPTT